jgi:adenine-specific DNA-methyltransferase
MIEPYINIENKDTTLLFQQDYKDIIRNNNITALRNSTKNKHLELENRRYIGSKAKLTSWIFSNILMHINNFDSFFDVFAGTAIVSKAAIPYCNKIIMNDFLYSNNVIYTAFFSQEDFNNEKINNFINYYNNIDPICLQDNYFSLNFGGKFFDNINAKLIGYIRQNIEENKGILNNKEYCILLTTLIYNIDRIANTVGHFDAYIKKPIKHVPLFLLPIKELKCNSVDIYRENANMLAPKIVADVAYVDPPYNSRQYSRFYHIYENLIKWQKPKLYGVALKPKEENMSSYCSVNAGNSLKHLVDNLNVKYIVVSYNNTYNSKSNSSKNKISLEEIKYILERRGETTIYECPYQYFNTGKTELKNHKEILFITKIEI